MAGRLIVEPVGGLTNRLMALLSVQRIALRYDLEFGVCWNVSSECGAGLGALFDTAFAEYTLDMVDADTDRRTIGFGGQGWATPPVVARPESSRDIWIKTHGVLAHDAETRDAGFVPGGPIIFDLGRYYRALRPKAEIKAMADAIPFERHRTVGIHIRRPYSAAVELPPELHTAEQITYGRLPDAFYADIVNRLHALNPALDFLLCTNSKTTETYLQENCAARLISSPKITAENTALASSAHEALVDTLLLSRTCGIVRHHQSHFAFLSSLVNFQPTLIVVPDGDGSQAGVNLHEYGDHGAIAGMGDSSVFDRFVLPRYNMLLL